MMIRWPKNSNCRHTGQRGEVHRKGIVADEERAVRQHPRQFMWRIGMIGFDPLRAAKPGEQRAFGQSLLRPTQEYNAGVIFLMKPRRQLCVTLYRPAPGDAIAAAARVHRNQRPRRAVVRRPMDIFPSKIGWPQWMRRRPDFGSQRLYHCEAVVSLVAKAEAFIRHPDIEERSPTVVQSDAVARRDGRQQRLIFDSPKW